MRLMSTLRSMKGTCLDLMLRHALRGRVSGRAALRLYRWLTRGMRDVRVLPVIWLDRLAKKENALLRSGGEGTSYFNQDEVFFLLEKYGFSKVFIEDLEFSEQVRTLNQAEFIVGPTGAAWTNLIFSRAGAKALCWMAEESSNFSAYSNIAKIVGVDLRCITCKAGVQNTGELYAKVYRVDVDKSRLGLAELGLHTNPEALG